jgi:hypothetical protein
MSNVTDADATALNPLTYIGLEAIPELGMNLVKGAKTLPNVIKTSKKSGLLSNAYKINPLAFKPNPEAYYRVLGKEGINDALESGVIRANPKNIHPFSGQPVYDKPYFSKGVPFDRDWKSPFKNKKGKQAVGSIYPDETMVEVFGHDKFYPTNDLVTSPSVNLTPFDESVNLYKRDWLHGYKEVPKELPGSPNTSLVTTKMGPSFGMDMSKYEIKNPDYFTQLLDTYDNKALSSTNKKFYKDLIGSVKKQNGLVTERQYNELQRLKTGNFNFGKKGYADGGNVNNYTELELTAKEIKNYIDNGYIIEDID